MAKADAKASKGAKGAKDDKKDKKGKKGKNGTSDGPVMSVARHPTAGPQVRRAKGFGGLVGFVAAATMSYQANVPPLQVGLRALAVGLAGFLVAWACSVTVWRILLTAQLRVLYDELHAPKEPPASDSTVPQVPVAPNAN